MSALTEKQWLRSRDDRAMLGCLPATLSTRKIRLFAVAAFRSYPEQYRNRFSQEAIDVAELLADGSVTEYRRRTTIKREKVGFQAYNYCGGNDEDWIFLNIRHCYSLLKRNLGLFTLRQTCQLYGDTFSHASTPPVRHRQLPQLLRDIFGNPFRSVAFDPKWQTDTAVALAQTMYDALHFHAMPILADALQDAGCEDATILDHCRDEHGLHVRGCWVVDLVLGKA